MADEHLNTPEVWKAISDYPGYEVSNLGRVKSYLKSIPAILKPVVKKQTGYAQLNLRKDSKFKSVKVHHLVLLAFYGPCPVGHQTCHNDGDRTNNILSNLRWGTALDNAQDRHNHGNDNPSHGENHYRTNFTESQIMAIRYLFSIGFNNMTLADMYQTSRSNISNIVHRKNWKHI